jgi:hypothetical protein
MKIWLALIAIVVLLTASALWTYSHPEAFMDTGAHRGDISYFIPRYGQGADGCIWMPWGKNLWRCW